MAKRKKLIGAEADAVEVSPIKIVNQAVANCSPLLVLHSIRRGGFIYKVPAPPQNEAVSRHIAIRWILESARNKDKNKRIWVSLAHELINAANNEGTAIGKKRELIKQCEENRAYANYRIY
ncbi:28S ribosomal protein S7 mitochondrial [Taenia solium]|eukprot:TsM_000769000 transcript=TsM_000769000 gene=TsM_000769000